MQSRNYIPTDARTLLHTLPLPFAIFDIHFAPSSHGTLLLLGAATSTGSLALYRISIPSAQITPIAVHQLFPETSLITHFAWHPAAASTASLALSDGSIYLCSAIAPPAAAADSPSPTTPTCTLLHAHALEAWFTAFTPTGDRLLTGGDDSVLACLDATAAAGAPPLWQDRRTHLAGVTAVLPLATAADGRRSLFLTGSYDDRVRLLEAPPPGGRGRPTVLAERDVGGGVWRLQEVGGGDGGAGGEVTVLASCMHAGARVLRVARKGEGEWEFEEVARFEEHRSMNYGSGVQPGTGGRTVMESSAHPNAGS
ncbi:Prohibitin [Neofusicoccum parvum]|uniref:Prohibitin n=1 Tax=Neofusicoccum parvum TaxID=310453 RepID=A0ACB5SIJ0_9PEZI|nr:Prohibitin [Neofusicoccum parvum]